MMPLRRVSLMGASSIALLLLAMRTATAAEPNRGPFTEPARSVRTRAFDVEHVRLELVPDWDQRQVTGRVVHRVVPFEAGDRIEFDAGKMTIHRVSLSPDGGELEFDHDDSRLIVRLGRKYPAGEALTVAIDFQLDDPQQGLHFVVPDDCDQDRHRVVWTQSQPDFARYWFPCFDSPNDRFTSETLTTVPDGYFVLSNGELKERRDNGDGTVTWHWAIDKSHVAYLMSVVAGRFEAYEQQWDGISIVSYVPPERMSDADRSFGKTAAMVQYFSEKIGYRYPWSKYTQICCDEYSGGMEHTSATTLGLGTLHDERAHLDVSSEGLVAHELAHQWWGDLLTCKDWAEIWLNESFATYFDALWTEHERGWDEAVWQGRAQREAYLTEDKSRYRRPLVTYRYEHAWNMFDRHTYPKGARILHMLRYEVGDEMFWKGLNRYCRDHAYGVVETADLRVAFEQATGRGLNWFFDQWVYHGGHPEFDVSYTYDESQRMVRLVVKQTQTVDDLTPLFRAPVEIELGTADGPLVRKITVTKAEETFHFELPERPRWVAFDPDDWLLKTLDFDQPKGELIAQLADSEHVMVRARAAEWLGRYKPEADAAAALAEALEGDSFWGVRETAAKTLGDYRGDAAREALLQAAGSDAKSAVRRAAIKSLDDFAHDDVRAALRRTIAEDPSYYAVADALETLVKIDRESVRDDLLAALEQPSHNEVVLSAACNGLVEIDDSAAKERLLALLEPTTTPARRRAVIGSLAKLAGGDDDVVTALIGQLDDANSRVRQAAITALGESGSDEAIDALQARRDNEGRSRMLSLIDEALGKLRGSTDLAALKREVRQLKDQNEQLEQRLTELEAIESQKAAPAAGE